jgi:hypothetical protein
LDELESWQLQEVGLNEDVGTAMFFLELTENTKPGWQESCEPTCESYKQYRRTPLADSNIRFECMSFGWKMGQFRPDFGEIAMYF